MQKKINYSISKKSQAASAIHYSITGKGKPVFLIHGFGEDRSIWDPIIATLQQKYKFIVPDLPGSGASPVLNKARPTIVDFAHCIKAIADQEKIKTCTVIGHSMGGYITMAVAEKYPTLLNAYGLFHSSAYADTDEKKTIRSKSIDFIEANGSIKFLKTIIPGLFFNKKKSALQIKSMLESGKKFEATALIQYYHAMKTRPDRSKLLKKLKVPVLFIFGRHDQTIPIDLGLKQSCLPTESHVFILEKSAHMGMLEETEQATVFLDKFLQHI